MKLSPEQIAELVASLPWKQDARGYAIIKRSHVVAFLSQGKTVAPNEVIHHINENKADDRAENLVVMTKAEHARLHAPHKLTPGVEYTPELREKRRQQMLGNKHAVGSHNETPELKAQRIVARKHTESLDPEIQKGRSAKLKEIWRLRREGKLPMPDHGTVQ